MLPNRPTGERPDSDGCKRRSEGCCTGCGNVHTPQACHDCQRVDVTGLSLVSAHAQCGVTLQVLHGQVAFLMRDLQVLDANIVLEIYKRLIASSLGWLPDRLDAVAPSGVVPYGVRSAPTSRPR